MTVFVPIWWEFINKSILGNTFLILFNYPLCLRLYDSKKGDKSKI